MKLITHNGLFHADDAFSSAVLLTLYPENVRLVRTRNPKEWGGLRDEALQRVTGVSDAVFCHTGLFLCGAKSKEGAITLARKALEA